MAFGGKENQNEKKEKKKKERTREREGNEIGNPRFSVLVSANLLRLFVCALFFFFFFSLFVFLIFV